jgi:hypothetical protein
MGIVASSDHMMGNVKSAISPSETKVAQKTLRSILLFYRQTCQNVPKLMDSNRRKGN